MPVIVPIGSGAGGGAAGAVALVRGLAGDRIGQEREAAVLAGVVDLGEGAVLVLRDERVAGEEEGVGAVGARTEEARVERADPGRDQLRRLAVPLVGVLAMVEVPRSEGVGRS